MAASSPITAVSGPRGTRWIRRAVSCPCPAQFQFLPGSGHLWQRVIYNGASGWSQPLNVDSHGAFYSVSCASPKFCVGGQRQLRHHLQWHVLVSRQHRHQRAPRVFLPESDLLHGRGRAWERLGIQPLEMVQTGQARCVNEMVSVSCHGTTFCMAVDLRGDVLSYRGSKGWSKPARSTPTTTCPRCHARARPSAWLWTAWEVN